MFNYDDAKSVHLLVNCQKMVKKLMYFSNFIALRYVTQNHCDEGFNIDLQEYILNPVHNSIL